MNQITQRSGTILILLSALMFGSYGVLSRLIGDAMGNFYQGWTRALTILILLVPIALLRKEIIKIEKSDRKWLIVFLLFTSLTQAPIFYAFNHMDIGSASLLFFVSTFLTMNVIGVIFFKEKLSTVKILSSILAIIGMYLVFSFSITAFVFTAGLMAIINGIASGGEIAFSKKLTGNYSPLYVVVLSWAIILITNAIISIALGEPQISPSFSLPWLWQLCYSMASLFGFLFVIAGIKYIEASIGALLGLFEIIFSILFGMLIFKESLTLSVGVGGLLIIVASALPSIQDIYTSKFKRT